MGLVYHTRFGNGSCAYHNAIIARNDKLYMLVSYPPPCRTGKCTEIIDTLLFRSGNGMSVFGAHLKLGRANSIPGG